MVDARFRSVSGDRIAGIAPAKLNLFLEVVGRRADGFHELATVFHEIDLADEIAVELAPASGDDRLTIAGIALDGVPADNLVLKAVRAFRRRVASAPRVAIELVKRVPPGTGMGGGSADAAFVLGALRTLVAPDLPESELRAAAREVGSDVGFFLRGGTAIGRGRGDELEALEGVGPFTFLVAVPPFSISTAAAYRHVDLIEPRRAVCSFVEGMKRVAGSVGDGPSGECFNRLENAAAALEPALLRWLVTLRNITDRPWVMTGSGSALFAPMEGENDAASLLHALADRRELALSIAHSFDRHSDRDTNQS